MLVWTVIVTVLPAPTVVMTSSVLPPCSASIQMWNVSSALKTSYNLCNTDMFVCVS
jgi:hypothetical protein